MTVYDEKPWGKWYDPQLGAEIKAVDETYLDIMERGLKFRP